MHLPVRTMTVSSDVLQWILFRCNSFVYNFIAGSYMAWDLEDEQQNGDPVTTYGPFPCKAIPKVIVKELNGQPLIAFMGGLPRASYSDKHTVSVIHDSKHVVFDLTSKVSF